MSCLIRAKTEVQKKRQVAAGGYVPDCFLARSGKFLKPCRHREVARQQRLQEMKFNILISEL